MIRRYRLAALLLYASLATAQTPGSHPSLEDAQKAEKAGDLGHAEVIYRKMLEHSPDAELYQRLGLVQHLQNKFSDAGHAFERALQLNADLWTSHLFLGIDYYRTNRFTEARDQLQASERLHPQQPETRFWLGAAHLALHEYWDGLENLESVLEKDPHNVDALQLLAESYADYGTQLLNQVADKYPDSAAGLQVQGRALEFEGSKEAALQFYRAAAAKDRGRAGLQEAIARLEKDPQ